MKILKTGRPIWVYYQDIDSGSNLEGEKGGGTTESETRAE